MKIECVTVCVNYSDFLAWTLPANAGQFDRMVVVTRDDDHQTQRLCQYYGVKCVPVKIEGTINKAKLINEGLKHLSKDEWVVQLDADIYLPPKTRHVLQHVHLDKEAVYGIDRLMCNSFEEWIQFLSAPNLVYHDWIFTEANIFPVGTRVVQHYGLGYLPIGFFQLWNPKMSGIMEYPTEEDFYDRTDVLFAKMFGPGKRRFLPDIVSIHLDSLHSTMGKNWKGRKTPQFKLPPTNPSGSAPTTVEPKRR
jgi:hypothetical protein